MEDGFFLYLHKKSALRAVDGHRSAESTAKEKGLDSCRGGENNLSYMLRDKIVMVTTKLPPHWVQ